MSYTVPLSKSSWIPAQEEFWRFNYPSGRPVLLPPELLREGLEGTGKQELSLGSGTPAADLSYSRSKLLMHSLLLLPRAFRAWPIWAQRSQLKVSWCLSLDSSNSLKKGLGFRRDPRKNVREGGSQKVVPMQDASMSQLLLWAAGLRATGDPKSCPIKEEDVEVFNHWSLSSMGWGCCWSAQSLAFLAGSTEHALWPENPCRQGDLVNWLPGGQLFKLRPAEPSLPGPNTVLVTTALNGSWGLS